jgi:NADH-quinone oxidoreductase subunit N
MKTFAPILPELVLGLGAIVLMMIAAFVGRRGSAITTWGGVALLAIAGLTLFGPPSSAGPLFGGMISADLFSAFG